MAGQQNWQALLIQRNNEVAVLLARISELDQRLAAANRQLTLETRRVGELTEVLDEYDRTVTLLFDEKADFDQHIQRSVAGISQQRDEQQEQLRNQELEFADLHSKYEKCKEVATGLQSNIEMMMNTMTEYTKAIGIITQQYKTLKIEVARDLYAASTEVETGIRNKAAEMAKAKAQLKRMDLQKRTLENTLQRKTRENEELGGICDQLMADADAAAGPPA